jgi:TonB family protein
VALWMAYAIVVGGAALVCGAVAERLADRTPRRAIWICMLVASVGIPLTPRSWWKVDGGLAAGGNGQRNPDSGIGGVMLPESMGPAMTDQVLLAIWLLMSIFGVAVLLRSWRILRRDRAGWSRANLADVAVLISEATGPGVIATVPPSIVVPEWVRSMTAEDQRMLISHEREHIRAGDPFLLLVAALVVAVFPWNPAIWQQYRRLKNAVEMDCDRRVLAGGVERDRYLRLLLEAAERVARNPAGGVALGVAAPPLERRLRLIAGLTRPVRGPRAAGLVLVAGLILLLVGRLPAPQVPQFRTLAAIGSGAAPVAAMARDHSVDLSRPEILNRHQAPAIVGGAYPPHLRAAGVGGTAIVAAYVAPSGAIGATTLVSSSGIEELDEAADEVIRQFRFRPARAGGEPVGGWAQHPITFVPPAGPPEQLESAGIPARLAIWTTERPLAMAMRAFP